MKITKITKLKSGLYQLNIINDDNEELKFKLSEDVLIEHNLYSNKIITQNDLDFLNQLANYSKLYTSTLNFIAFKMRSEKEVKDYLLDKKSSLDLTNEIIEKLKKINYINDQIYSDSYVKYQFDTNKKGINVIKDELLKKGINNDYINHSLTYVKPEMIIANLNSLINYYLKINKNKTIRKLKENLLRNLLVKGYEYADIVKCLNEYPFEANDDNLIDKELNKALQKYQKKFSGFELRNRIIKALMSKGFEYDNILNSLSEFNFD